MSDCPNVLLVEDSRFFGKTVCHRIEEELGFNVVWRDTYAGAVELVESGEMDFLVALLDLTLPDAPDGEIVSYVTGKGIPGVIVTGRLDDSLREQFLAWNIVDYILKESADCISDLIRTIRRLQLNQSIGVLVVDDSVPIREGVVKLLGSRLYQVFSACDGVEALEIMDKHPEIKLVVTDYQMPNMDGFELVRRLRERSPKDELGIIGMSASNDPLLSAKFIKTGATDCMAKPFQVEEFHCRVENCIELLEHVEVIRDLSNKDPLTRLYNRRYFFENAPAFVERAGRMGREYCAAMLDIDFFKRVNDNYGHHAGDVVLQRVAAIVHASFASDAIVCRFGGEEFCVLASYGPGEDIASRFEQLRCWVEGSTIEVDGVTIEVTISTGVCTEAGIVESMLKVADERLYEAKETGRNKVVL